MKEQDNNLDEKISRSINGGKVEFDFESWKSKNPEALKALQQGPASSSAKSSTKKLNLWRMIMRSRIIKFVAAAVFVIVFYLVFANFEFKSSGVAFGEVFNKIGDVQSIHARIIQSGKVLELWAKRPNKLRIEYDDGNVEISNGPVLWVIDVKNNTATKKSSWYYEDAQKKGIDVIEAFLQMEYSENFSGFFQEKPVEKVVKGLVTYDLYKVKVEEYGGTIQFESLVESDTHMIYSVLLEAIKDGYTEQILRLDVLDYNQDLVDSVFTFEQGGDMQVIVQEMEKGLEAVNNDKGGATLSGSVVWASNGQPVVGATITCTGGRRKPEGGYEFFVRSITDKDGCWETKGAPKGLVNLDVRSWELDWPALLEFAENISSSRYPSIVVDGQSEYRSLNFKVYKPKEFFATITIDVNDENGQPIEGIGAYLQYCDDNRMNQHVYAKPRIRQFTSNDGRFVADNIWPTEKKVQIFIVPEKDFGSIYATRSAFSEPFIIELQQQYHFDIMVPFVREMEVQVVDVKDKPMEHIAVNVLDWEGAQFYPLSWKMKNVFTDEKGRVTVSGMSPGEEVIVILKRLSDDSSQDKEEILASACYRVEAPTKSEIKRVRLVFDDRPIIITGKTESDFLKQNANVFIMITGDKGEFTMPFMHTKFDESGQFIFKGVLEGQIRILCTSIINGSRETVEQEVVTEAGQTYLLEVSREGIEPVE